MRLHNQTNQRYIFFSWESNLNIDVSFPLLHLSFFVSLVTYTLYEVWGHSSQCQRCYSVVFGTVTALADNSNVCEHRWFALPSRMQKSPKNSSSSLSEVTPYDNVQERVYWAIAIPYIRSQLVAYLQYVLPEAPRKELKVVESV